MNELRHFIHEKEFDRRIKWFIKLRWLAALGLFIVITGVNYILKIDIQTFQLYLGNAVLIIYNILFSYYCRYLDSISDSPKWLNKANFLANIQSSLDLTLLTILIHFSGGIENPFLFFYIFHMVIASILLTNKAAYLQATYTTILFGIVLGGESLNFLPHYHLSGFSTGGSCDLNFSFFLVRYIAFFSTLYITVYISTTIINVLRERETDLKEVNEQLEEKDRAKSQYVMRVTHDLKSSLSAIQTCLKVVLAGITGEIPEKSRDMVTRAAQRSLSLHQFVEDLLDLSIIRAAKEIEKKKISLSQTLRKVVEQLRPQANKAGLELTEEYFSPETAIHGNQKILESMLINLIMNSIKYTPEGGKIIIRTGTTRGSHLLRVSISDTGIGIPEKDLPQIFEDFYRAENVEQLEKDGSGLGLSMVKQIAEVHGGTIDVKSEVGKGSVFMLTFPLYS
ncbi:MAG: HAMP domain-containing histidine kinase [Spirochaetes bacterium]|nr:HAMP domain-containing histidine kinase [Spirochaetota bacterium]